jgi:drug/metabolite transporter (DMT)-like permease
LPRSLGDWLGLAAGVLFALSVTLVRKGEAIGGLEQTMVSFATAALLSLALLLVTPLPAAPIGPAVLAWAGLASVAWLLPTTWLLLWGARFLEPGRVSLLLLFEVAVAALSAALLADEPFGLREGLGCILILAAGAMEGAAELRTSRRTPTCLPPCAPTTVSDLEPLVE